MALNWAAYWKYLSGMSHECHWHCRTAHWTAIIKSEQWKLHPFRLRYCCKGLPNDGDCRRKRSIICPAWLPRELCHRRSEASTLRYYFLVQTYFIAKSGSLILFHVRPSSWHTLSVQRLSSLFFTWTLNMHDIVIVHSSDNNKALQRDLLHILALLQYAIAISATPYMTGQMQHDQSSSTYAGAISFLMSWNGEGEPRLPSQSFTSRYAIGLACPFTLLFWSMAGMLCFGRKRAASSLLGKKLS